MSRFEWAVRAEFATQHLMHEKGLVGSVELWLRLGYDLQIEDKKLWAAIQKAYELPIARCLKEGFANSKDFKFVAVRPLEGL